MLYVVCRKFENKQKTNFECNVKYRLKDFFFEVTWPKFVEKQDLQIFLEE